MINSLSTPTSELQINFGVLQIDEENSATGLINENFGNKVHQITRTPNYCFTSQQSNAMLLLNNCAVKYLLRYAMSAAYVINILLHFYTTIFVWWTAVLFCFKEKQLLLNFWIHWGDNICKIKDTEIFRYFLLQVSCIHYFRLIKLHTMF